MPYEIIISRELCESNAEWVAIILDAALACPVNAITLIDHTGTKPGPETRKALRLTGAGGLDASG
jgi:hypothetical protein